MKRISVTVAFLVLSFPSLLAAQAQTFIIHGSAKRCNDITQLDSALFSHYEPFFAGWTLEDYDTAIAWASQCSQYGWQNTASSRIPTLQSLSAPLRPVVVQAPPRVEEPKGIVFHGDIASWSGIPPLPPDSATKQSPQRSVHCTVGDAADHMVSIWTTEKGCKEWLDAANKLAANGPTHRQVEDFRARQIAYEPADPNNIYAIFLCFQVNGECQMYGAPRMQLGEYTAAITFVNAKACQEYISSRLTPYKPNAQGRSTAGPGMWYECRSKHVDTWQPAR
jgi:hypothetical protein